MRANTSTLLRRLLAWLIPIGSMCWVLSVPQRLGYLVFSEQILALLLGCALGVVFLKGAHTPHDAHRTGSTILATLAVLACVYLSIRIPILSEEAFFRPIETLTVALIIVPLVVEGMRRTVGLSLVIVFALFVLYALFGDQIPGKLQGRALSAPDLLRFLGTDTTAMLGLPLSVTCFVVVMFVFFGRLLQTSGGTALFTDLGQSLAGRGPGGPAKVSIIASSLFGSVSGSAVSNVMSTGVVTIPLMQRSGIVAYRAGAIEAVASTGGQLMPPIMGAAAFLMAEFLQMPYKDIIVAALIPAVLYYVALFLQVDFLARRSSQLHGLDVSNPSADEKRVSLLTVLSSAWLLVIPFAILLTALFYFNLSPEFAVLIACVGLIVLSLARRDPSQRLLPKSILVDLTKTGESVSELILVTAVAGMIIGILSNTGLSFSLGFVLLSFGDNNIFLLLILTGLVCIVLGMGLPTTGVYLLLATLAAPPLIELGLSPLQAHLFVLYYGMLSMITPPVALAAFAAASLTGAGQMRTGFEAMRLGWCAYLVPFLFVYHPALLMQGSVVDIVLTLLRVLLALILISGALAGYGFSQLTYAIRCGLIMLAALILLPLSGQWATVTWIAVACGLLACYLLARKSTHQVSPGVSPGATPDCSRDACSKAHRIS